MERRTDSENGPTRGEIEQKLKEINLTVLAKERMAKLEWFYKNNIRVIIIETSAFLLPENVNEKEFYKRLDKANIALKELVAELNWFKENNLLLELKNDEYKYKGVAKHGEDHD